MPPVLVLRQWGTRDGNGTVPTTKDHEFITTNCSSGAGYVRWFVHARAERTRAPRTRATQARMRVGITYRVHGRICRNLLSEFAALMREFRRCQRSVRVPEMHPRRDAAPLQASDGMRSTIASVRHNVLPGSSPDC